MVLIKHLMLPALAAVQPLCAAPSDNPCSVAAEDARLMERIPAERWCPGVGGALINLNLPEGRDCISAAIAAGQSFAAPMYNAYGPSGYAGTGYPARTGRTPARDGTLYGYPVPEGYLVSLYTDNGTALLTMHCLHKEPFGYEGLFGEPCFGDDGGVNTLVYTTMCMK